MPIRTRVGSVPYTGSRILKGNGSTSSKTIIAAYERVEDETGPSDNLPFFVTRTLRSGGLIHGENKSNLSGYKWFNYPCTYWANAFMTSHLSIPGRPSNGDLAAETLARSQPYKSEIISAEYLSELSGYGAAAEDNFRKVLRRIERVVPRKAWNTIRGGAKANIITQFALLPLLSDIQTLLEFQERVDRRVDVLERLYSRGGYRRTYKMWDGSSTAHSSNVVVQNQGVTLRADFTKVTTQHVKTHVRWHTIIPLIKSDADIRAQAKKLILGARFDPYTAYELMPWSWLIDYFVNVGRIVKGSGNALELRHDAVRVMDTRRTETRSFNTLPVNQGGFIVDMFPMTAIQEDKSRVLATPELIAQTEMLEWSQLSILASLAVLRVRPRDVDDVFGFVSS